MPDEKTLAPKTPEPKPASTPAPVPAPTAADKAVAGEESKQAKADRDAAHETADEKRDAAVAEADRVAKEEKDAADAVFAAHEAAERNLKSGNLADAGGTSDARVHQLLAERQTARMNHDAAAEAAVARKLGMLGYK